MNVLFLVLIAIPLGAYLLILVFSTSRLSVDERQAKPAHAAADAVVGEGASQEATIHAPEVAVVTSLETITASVGAENAMVVAADSNASPGETPVSEQVVEATASSGEAPDGEQVVASTAAAAAVVLPLPEQSTAAVQTEPEEVVPVVETSAAVDPALAVPTPLIAASELPSAGLQEAEESEPILPAGPVVLPSKGTPKYAFDYRGRLWVEKKQKGFFRQLRRPLLPPDDPPTNSGR